VRAIESTQHFPPTPEFEDAAYQTRVKSSLEKAGLDRGQRVAFMKAIETEARQVISSTVEHKSALIDKSGIKAEGNQRVEPDRRNGGGAKKQPR
jgi:hypothetical protein